MSTPASGDGSYAGQNYSIPQLLHAAKRKLQGTTFGGRIATSWDMAEVDALEYDALQVLSLVRFIKNTFAPVNRIPPEVLTLVPDYWEGSGGETLIKLTHVCRSWREIFTSHPSLWIRLDCMNVDKTRTHIERSKTSLLEICLGKVNVFFQEGAFLLAVPHIDRLGALSVSGNPAQVLPVLVEHFSCHVPLLSKLDINLICNQASTLPDTLFNGDLSSLRELRLTGVITPLPWKGLSNLTTFNLCHVPEDNILLTQLLDFFESAPQLRHIQLHDFIPRSGNTPTERVVFLPHLKDLSIVAQPARFVLNHLSIPAGVSMYLESTFRGKRSPISSHLPNPPDRLHNLSHITAVNLYFDWDQRSLRLDGPSGGLFILGNWMGSGDNSTYGTGEFLWSLGRLDISRTRWLAITRYCLRPSSDTSTSITKWCTYHTLCSMNNLCTLTLSRCKNLIFILVLDPSKNPSGTVLCPKLEEIILYIERPGQLHVDEMSGMAEERASRGVKLSAVTIVGIGAIGPAEEVSQLRKHVPHVEYRFDGAPPEWDTLPN